MASTVSSDSKVQPSAARRKDVQQRPADPQPGSAAGGNVGVAAVDTNASGMSVLTAETRLVRRVLQAMGRPTDGE